MADKTIENINHNYEPVNKYIDDQARLKRSVSSWRYAKSTALILVAAGILAVLLAWAYHIFKKPHYLKTENNKLMQEDKKDLLNQELNMKEEKINDLEKKLKENPENNLLKDEITKLQNEKKKFTKSN